MDQNSYISDFRYIQTDMSIFSYEYIGMDISEMMMSEVSEISEIGYIQISHISRPICPFLALDISEMDISEMKSSNVSEISEFPIYPFPISQFSDKPPFLPTPRFVAPVLNSNLEVVNS
jgi:hypothetical protein